MNWCYHLDDLEFDDYFAFHQQINTITTIQIDISIDYWQCFLAFNCQSLIVQLKKQARFVCRFQEPGAKLPVNPDSRPDDLFANSIQSFLHRSIFNLSHLLRDLCVLSG